MLTIIPDLHADPERLARTLDMAGSEAPFLFLGDLIEAGRHVPAPSDAAVLERIRGLVEDGRAMVVMGNHELNAALFHRSGSDGRPLRAHSEKNQRQHRSFLACFGTGTREALEWTNWFLDTLPLWIERDGVRAVHAFWGEDDINEVARRRPDGLLREEDLPEIAAEATPFARAVKRIVSGPETQLPEPYRCTDYQGFPRTEVRLAWWRDQARGWREAVTSVADPEQLPPDSVHMAATIPRYRADAPPVLFGHYKMKGRPRVENPAALCLDYSLTPCAYRWSGEVRLREDRILAAD